MGEALADVRFGLRMLRRNPSFTSVALLTLALGIGANTAMFTVLSAVVLRPLPFADPERLVAVQASRDGRLAGWGTSLPDFEDWRRDGRGFAGMATSSYWTFNLVGSGEPLRILGARVSGDFFSVLGVAPRLGRAVAPADDRPEAEPVAVLSEGLWRRVFGGDPGVLGRKVTLNGIAHTIVGVMPRSFAFPSAEQELWAPLANEMFGVPRDARFLYTIARLGDGTDLRQAQASLDGVSAGLAAKYPATNAGTGASLLPLHEAVVGDVRRGLLVLSGAVGFVLLIACANVSNLLLARGAFRRREVAVRTALGASRARILRQFLAENLLLGALGGALGMAVASIAVALVRRFGPADLPRLDTASLDFRVLAFTAAASVVTGVVLGLVPAVHGWRAAEALAASTRAGGALTRSRLRRGLVVAETALALSLLMGGGLLIRSFRNLLAVPLGFEAERLATASVFLTPPRYMSLESQIAFVRRLLDGARRLPGASAVAVASQLPLDDGPQRFKLALEGRPTGRAAAPVATYRVVSADYFRAMGMPLRAGRALAESDSETAPPVVVVNETMARRLWPGQSPLGRRLAWVPEGDPAEGKARWHTVVGVVGDTRSAGLDADEGSAAYVPYAQRVMPFIRTIGLVVRTSADPRAVLPELRSAFHGVDPEQPVFRERIMAAVVSESLDQRRFVTVLLQAFAAAAFALAMIGIYGVLSYTVGQRTREIGIRMALGARPGGVVGLVVRDGLGLALAGIATGIPLALVLARSLGTLLFGVPAWDAGTLAAVTAAVIAAGIAACMAPAIRASRVTPMVALRQE